MILTGAQGRGVTRQFDASGTITAGGTTQLVVPEAKQRTSFTFQNISDTTMYVDFGSARATATLSSGTVASCSVTDAGFGFSKPPIIQFLGGGNTGNNQNNPTFNSATLPDFAAPARPAQAHCVMTGSAPNQSVASIVIDDPGSGYASAPYVFITNDPNDPAGCAIASAGAGSFQILPGGSITSEATVCPTDQMSVFCASTGKAFTYKFTI